MKDLFLPDAENIVERFERYKIECTRDDDYYDNKEIISLYLAAINYIEKYK
jgi:hypothetical protein